MKCNFTGTLLSKVQPPLLGTEFILGMVGNSAALWIFCFHVKPWKSSTVLLFNLALADLLLLAALPFRAFYYHSGLRWSLGEPMCNLILFMLALNRSGSTFFLVAIAADRYARVVHPHHPVNQLRVARAALGAVGLWLLTGAMTAHIFGLRHHLDRQDSATYCESFSVDSKPGSNFNWHKLHFVLTFVLPLLAIIYFTMHIVVHLRRRRQLGPTPRVRRALAFIVLVVALFVVCFLPTNILQVVIWVRTSQVAHNHSHSQVDVCAALDGLTSAFFFSFSLTYLNSALDPLVYYFSSPTIQKVCRRALRLPQLDIGDTTDTTDKKTRETGSQSLSQL